MFCISTTLDLVKPRQLTKLKKSPLSSFLTENIIYNKIRYNNTKTKIFKQRKK